MEPLVNKRKFIHEFITEAIYFSIDFQSVMVDPAMSN